MLKSFLFIPGDSERKLGKGDASGADALILDLEDSVARPAKGRARDMTVEYLLGRPPGRRTAQLWVRINPLDSGLALGDLAAVARAAPDGLILPKANGPDDVRMLSHYLDALEVQAGLAPGAIGIMPIATETAIAPFRLGDYATAGLTRLAGISWGAEDLSAAVGAGTNRNADGTWALTYQMVRSLTLLAAHASGVPAIETLFADYRDEEGLRASCRMAQAEGFSGRLAIHPAQVAVINACFTPSEADIAQARRIVAAFAEGGGSGTIGFDGRMLDIPHLKQAQAILARLSAGSRN